MSSDIRSFWPRSAHPLGLLSNRRINHYIRAGVYGEVRRQRLLRGEAILADRERLREVRKAEREARRKPRLSQADLDAMV